VMLALLHLLKEPVLEHLLLELLQGGLDLIIEDNDFHSAHPAMPRRTIALGRDGVVDDIQLLEPLRSVFNGTADRRECPARLLDTLPCIVHNPPAPARLILRRGPRGALPALTTDSGAGPHRRENRRQGPRASRAGPSKDGRDGHDFASRRARYPGS